MKMKFIIVSVIAFATLAGLGYAHERKQPGKELYQSLPQAERMDFLAFSLGEGYTRNSTNLQRTVPDSAAPDFTFPDALGIDDELIQKFRTLQVPDNFATDLFVWIRARYNLDQTKMRELILNRSVCLSNGECIDIGDIGGLCCPF